MSENTQQTIDLTGNEHAAALVFTIKAAVNGAGKYEAYIADFASADLAVTRDNLADHARALAALAYPNEPQVQKKDGKRTKFGNAVQAAAAGLRTALGDDLTKASTDWIALMRQAVNNAHDKGEVAWDTLATMVADMAIEASSDGAK